MIVKSPLFFWRVDLQYSAMHIMYLNFDFELFLRLNIYAYTLSVKRKLITSSERAPLIYTASNLIIYGTPEKL